MLSNAEVAARLSEIADLLDLLGERFKPEAYRRAARSIEALPEDLGAIAARGELRSIPGVGEAIAEKVGELLRTGGLAYLDRLRGQVPAGVLELMRLPGVGPKTARRFWVELGIDGRPALAAAIEAGRLAGVKGFAERKIAQLRAASAATPPPTRAPIEGVWPLARAIVDALRAGPDVRQVEVAGSFRRGRETVGDLDVLVTSRAPEHVFDVFSRLPIVREVRLRGPTKETVVLADGLQVDLRVVEPEAFGAALQYFTGSKDHNVRLRSLARDRGLKVNEYGVYRGDERIAGRTEEDVYRALGLAWVPPELREDRGEIAAAAAGPLPPLVGPDDLTAELHVHLSAEPGADELDRLAAAARPRGIRAVGVVVAVNRRDAPTWRLPAGLRARFGRGAPDGVRLVPVEEVDTPTAEPDRAGPAPAYRVLVPRKGEPVPTARSAPPVPVRLIAHVGGDAESTRPIRELARAWGAAVEVGPGPDRFDSTGARLARESGVPLALPTGLGRPPDDPTAAVALGFARRAGAGPNDVLNARPGAAEGEPPAAPTVTRPARRRR